MRNAFFILVNIALFVATPARGLIALLLTFAAIVFVAFNASGDPWDITRTQAPINSAPLLGGSAGFAIVAGVLYRLRAEMLWQRLHRRWKASVQE